VSVGFTSWKRRRKPALETPARRATATRCKTPMRLPVAASSACTHANADAARWCRPGRACDTLRRNVRVGAGSSWSRPMTRFFNRCCIACRRRSATIDQRSAAPSSIVAARIVRERVFIASYRLATCCQSPRHYLLGAVILRRRSRLFRAAAFRYRTAPREPRGRGAAGSARRSPAVSRRAPRRAGRT
jgi:hypothetical protein